MQTTGRAMRKRQPNFLVSGILISILLFGAAYYFEHSIPAPGIGKALNGTLSNVKEKQLDTVLDLSKLFINWGFGLIAANAFFLKSAVDSKIRLKGTDLFLLEAGIVLTLISIFFGHLTFTNVIQLLEVDQFSAGSKLVSPYVASQYWSLVAALVNTVLLVHNFFWRTQHDTQARDVDSSLSGTDGPLPRTGAEPKPVED
jgi:hypothetical protein